MAFGGRKCCQRTSGFTRVDLLVVVVSLTCLASIGCLNVGQLREPAYRTQCINNLKQIGLATAQLPWREFRHFAGDTRRFRKRSKSTAINGRRAHLVHLATSVLGRVGCSIISLTLMTE